MIIKKNKEASKLKILNAAINVFAEHGYENATYKMIEAESGLSEALIPRYFGSKRGLAIAVIAKINDDFFVAVNKTIPKENLHEEFHYIGDFILETFCKYRTNLDALFAIVHYDKSFLNELTDYITLFTPDTERLKKFQEDGDIPEGIDLQKVYMLLITTLQSLLHMLLLTTAQPEERVRQTIHLSVDMFLYGLSPANKSLDALKSIK